MHVVTFAGELSDMFREDYFFEARQSICLSGLQEPCEYVDVMSTRFDWWNFTRPTMEQ